MIALRIETHLHTALTSTCAAITPAEILRGYEGAGYDAIVITDHFLIGDPGYYGVRGSIADAFLKGYRAVRELAERQGSPLRVLLGMEARLPHAIDDFLVYGVEEEMVRDFERERFPHNRPLREWADAQGVYICQAHPYRWGRRPVASEYIHGIEVYNGSPDNESHNDRAQAYAEGTPLRRQAGSDCHFTSGIGTAGIEAAADIHTGRELAAYMLRNQPELYIR